ncbi:hypothetical protein [Salinispora arenicola]|uniref:hypothetical protein n=1 Tax=Salinispora arenicola TaxID=168697 RepID=UPI0027DE9CB3|nr:hypothetical protein [Salinispora arenicola]
MRAPFQRGDARGEGRAHPWQLDLRILVPGAQLAVPEQEAGGVADEHVDVDEEAYDPAGQPGGADVDQRPATRTRFPPHHLRSDPGELLQPDGFVERGEVPDPNAVPGHPVEDSVAAFRSDDRAEHRVPGDHGVPRVLVSGHVQPRTVVFQVERAGHVTEPVAT